MPSNLATSLSAALDKAALQVIDSIAKDGLLILKSVLDKSGFMESEYLKDYHVFSHVISDTVVFEIQVNIEALDLDDDELENMKAIQDKTEELLQQKIARTYGLSGLSGVEQISGQRDARKD